MDSYKYNPYLNSLLIDNFRIYLSQALHYLPTLRVSCQKFGALEELEIAKVEAGRYGTGDQGEAVFFENCAAENGVVRDPKKGVLTFG